MAEWHRRLGGLLVASLYIVFLILAIQAAVSCKAVYVFLAKITTHEVATRMEFLGVMILVAVVVSSAACCIAAWRKDVSKRGLVVCLAAIAICGGFCLGSFIAVNRSVVDAVEPWTLSVVDPSGEDTAIQRLRAAGFVCLECRTDSGKLELVVLPNHKKRVEHAAAFLRDAGLRVEGAVNGGDG